MFFFISFVSACDFNERFHCSLVTLEGSLCNWLKESIDKFSNEQVDHPFTGFPISTEIYNESTMGEVFPLHYAAASGDLVMIEKLVNDDNVDVNTQIDIYFTTTPLDWAVAHKSLSAVAKLLYLGARVRNSDYLVDPVIDSERRSFMEIHDFLLEYECRARSAHQCLIYEPENCSLES